MTIALLLIVSGCGANYVRLDPSTAEMTAVQDLQLHAEEARSASYAALVQTTVRTPDLNRRFNIEIYARNDSLALYSGGFLGKGGFKAVAFGDSIAIALLSDKQVYFGLAADFIRPDISRYDYVRATLFEILKGDILLLSSDPSVLDLSSRWSRDVALGGDRIKGVKYENSRDSVRIQLKLRSPRSSFPRAAISEMKIEREVSDSRIKFGFIEAKYTDLPDNKFSMDAFMDWERLEYIEFE